MRSAAAALNDSVDSSVLYELFAKQARRHSQSIAIISAARSLTFAELVTRVSERRRVLQQQANIDATSRVVISCSDALASCLDVLACWQLGAAVAYLPPAGRESSQTLSRYVHAGFRHLLDCGDLASLNSGGETAELGGATVLFATSGTTGMPKIVAHNAATVAAGLATTVSLQEELLRGPMEHSSNFTLSQIVALLEDACLGLRFLCLAPFNSIAGFAVFVRALLAGETLVLEAPRDISTLVGLIEKHAVTNVGINPQAAHKLCRYLRASSGRLPSLVSLGVGGGRCSPAVIEELDSHLNVPVVNAFGMTETCGPIAVSRPDQPLSIRASTVGAPLPSVECKIRQSATSESMVETGDDDAAVYGQLLIRSPALLLGYLNDGHVVPALTDGWFESQDVARIDSMGNLEVRCRMDELIVRGGQKIDPHEIEAVLADHPDVEMCCVLGTTSRVSGEQDIHAFVAVSDPARALAQTFRSWCIERLPANMVPRAVTVLGALPVAGDGGIARARLREFVTARWFGRDEMASVGDGTAE